MNAGMKYSPATPSGAQRAELRAPDPPAGARCRHASSQTRQEQAKSMQGGWPGSRSWQCWRGHVEMNSPGSCQLLPAAFGAAPHNHTPVFGRGSVLPGWHAWGTLSTHSVPTGSQPCSSLPLPFYIPRQSLNLNEASRMVAPRQRLDERRAGVASGRAQGLSLPRSQGDWELWRNPGGHPGAGLGRAGSVDAGVVKMGEQLLGEPQVQAEGPERALLHRGTREKSLN